MVAMVKRLSQRVVVPLSRVRFPLATPTKFEPEMARFLFGLIGVRQVIKINQTLLNGVGLSDSILLKEDKQQSDEISLDKKAFFC